ADQDIIDRLQSEQGGKAAALLAGDHTAYPSPSEARLALGWKARFYGADSEQIARILLASGLFREKTSDQERERRARFDAEKAVNTYTGAFYDPHTYQGMEAPIIPPARIDGANAPVDAAEDRRYAELERRIAEQERELQAYRQLTESITMILACDQIETGPRITAIGVLLEGVSKRQRGEKPTPDGYHMPAEWIAR